MLLHTLPTKLLVRKTDNIPVWSGDGVSTTLERPLWAEQCAHAAGDCGESRCGRGRVVRC